MIDLITLSLDGIAWTTEFSHSLSTEELPAGLAMAIEGHPTIRDLLELPDGFVQGGRDTARVRVEFGPK